MKRSLMIVAALVAGSMMFANGAKESVSPAPQPVEEKQMTHEELVAAAQKEGTLTIYTHSSRTAKESGP